MATFHYDESSRVPFPVMKVVLSEPTMRTSIEVSPLVDTGFDGGLLLPLDEYLGLGLQSFEEPGGVSVARSALGLTVSLRSSRGLVTIGGVRYQSDVYTSPLLLRPLLGRELLNRLRATLDGPRRELTL